MKMQSILELSMWCYEKERRRKKDDYQRFSLSLNRREYFATVKDAESVIPSWINENQNHIWQDGIYCFRLTEYPIGIPMLYKDDNLSERIYNQNGEKLDERLYPVKSLTEDWKSEYRGRPDDKIKYKPGDVVEYAGDLYVIECFMTPLSRKEWTMADESDDGYLALRVDENADEIRYDKDGYVILDDQHPQCTDIFPPRFPFSPKIQRRIDNLRQFIKNTSKG